MVVDANLISALSGINWCYVSGVLEISLLMLEQTGASRQPLSLLQDKLPQNKYLLSLFPKPPDNTYRLKPWIKLVLRDDCSSSDPESALPEQLPQAGATGVQDSAAKISTTISGPNCLQLLDVHRLLLDSGHGTSVVNQRVWIAIIFLKARDSGHRLADLLYHHQEVATAVKHLRVFVERPTPEPALVAIRPVLPRPDNRGDRALSNASLDTGRNAVFANRRLSKVLSGILDSSSSDYQDDEESSTESGSDEERSAALARVRGKVCNGELLAVDGDKSESVSNLDLGEPTLDQADGSRAMGKVAVGHYDAAQFPAETSARDANVRDRDTVAPNSERNVCIDELLNVSNSPSKRKAPEECHQTENEGDSVNKSRSLFKKQKVGHTSDLNNVHLGSPSDEASPPKPSSSRELKIIGGTTHTSRCSLHARETLITPGDEALPYSGLNYADFVQDEQNCNCVQVEQFVADAVCSSSEAPICTSPNGQVTEARDLTKKTRGISSSSTTEVQMPSPSRSILLIRSDVSIPTKTGRTNEISVPSDQALTNVNEAPADAVLPSFARTNAAPSGRQTMTSKTSNSAVAASKILVDLDGLLFTRVKNVKVSTRVDLLCIVRSVVRPPCFLANGKGRRTLVALVDQSCGPDDDFVVTVFQNSRSDVLSRPICEADVVILRNVDIKLFQGQLRGSHTLRGKGGYETLVLESSAIASHATEDEGSGWTEGKHPLAVAYHREVTTLCKWWQEKQGDFSRLSLARVRKVQMPAVVFPYPAYIPALVATLSELDSEGCYDVFCRVLVTRSMSQCPMAYIKVEDGTELLVPAADVDLDALTQTMEESASQMPSELGGELSQQHARKDSNCRTITVCLGPSLLCALEFCREGQFVLLRHVYAEKNAYNSSFSFSLLDDNFSAIILLNDGHPQVAAIQRRLEEAADIPMSVEDEEDDSESGGGQPEPPTERQPEQPAEEQPESPAEEQPESPAEGQPESLAEGLPNPPVGGSREPPAEGLPEPPAEGLPKPPAEKLSEPPAEGLLEPSAEEKPEPSAEKQPKLSAAKQPELSAKEQPEPSAEKQPEPSAEEQPKPSAENQPDLSAERQLDLLVKMLLEPSTDGISGRNERGMSPGGAGLADAPLGTTVCHGIGARDNVDDGSNQNSSNNFVSRNDVHVNKASHNDCASLGEDSNTAGDFVASTDATTVIVCNTGEEERDCSFQHLNGGCIGAAANATDNGSNANVNTDSTHQASRALCSPHSKATTQNFSETVLPSPTQSDRETSTGSCSAVACDARNIAMEAEELIKIDFLQKASRPLEQRLAREWFEEVLGPFKTIANCRKTNVARKARGLSSSKPDCSKALGSTLAEKEICLGQFLQQIRVDEDARADADERFDYEKASASLRVGKPQVVSQASASNVACERSAVSGESLLSPRVTQSALTSGEDSVGRDGTSSSSIQVEQPSRAETADANKDIQSLVTESQFVSASKHKDCIQNTNFDVNVHSSSQHLEETSSANIIHKESLCRSPFKGTVISSDESRSFKNTSARISDVSTTIVPLCIPNNILSNPPSDMPEFRDQELLAPSAKKQRILRSNQLEKGLGTGGYHSVVTSVPSRGETAIVCDRKYPQPTSLEPCSSGTDVGPRRISTEGLAVTASQSAETNNHSTVYSQSNELSLTPYQVLNKSPGKCNEVEAPTIISTAGKENTPPSSATIDEACAEASRNSNAEVTPRSGSASTLSVDNGPTPISCSPVSAAASSCDVLDRSNITLTHKTAPCAVTSREDDVSGQRVIQEGEQAPPILSWRALLSAAAGLQSLSDGAAYRLSATVAALEPWAGSCGQKHCRESGSVCVHNLVSGVCGVCGAVYAGAVLRWLYTPAILRGQRLPCPACCPPQGKTCYPSVGLGRENEERTVQEDGHKGLTASERDEKVKSVVEGSVSLGRHVQDKKDSRTSKRIRGDAAELVGGASNSSPLHCEAKSPSKSSNTPKPTTCCAGSDDAAAMVRGCCGTGDSDMTADTWYTATSRGFSQRSGPTSDRSYRPKEGVTTRSKERGRVGSLRSELLKNVRHPSQSVYASGESNEESLSFVNHLVSSNRSCSFSNNPSYNRLSVGSFDCGTTPLACTSTLHPTSPSAHSRVSACISAEKNCSGITTTEAARHTHMLRPFLDLSAVLLAPPCGCGCAGASFTVRVRLEAAHKLLDYDDYSFEFCISSPSQTPDEIRTLASVADDNSSWSSNRYSSVNGSQDSSTDENQNSSAYDSQDLSAGDGEGTSGAAQLPCSQHEDVSSRRILTRPSTFRPKVKGQLLKQALRGTGKDLVGIEYRKRQSERLKRGKIAEPESDEEDVELELSCEAGAAPEEGTALDGGNCNTGIKREENFQVSSCIADSTVPSRLQEFKQRVKAACLNDRVHVLHVQALSSVRGPRSGGFTLEVVDVDTRLY